MRILILILCTSFFAFNSNAQDIINNQDSTLNNLQLPQKYPTIDINTFGKLTRKGQGKKHLILIASGGINTENVFEKLSLKDSSTYTMHFITPAGFNGTPSYPMPKTGTSYMQMTWHKYNSDNLIDYINDNELHKPVIITFMTSSYFIGLDIATRKPELISGIIALSPEPYRSFSSPQEAKEQTLDEVKTFVDENLAPQWFKTVTRKTWDTYDYPKDFFSLENEFALFVEKAMKRTVLPVYIRYLCESLAILPRFYDDEIKVPLLVLAPGFNQDFLSKEENKISKSMFFDSWNDFKNKKMITFKKIENAGICILNDNPESANDLISKFLKATLDNK